MNNSRKVSKDLPPVLFIFVACLILSFILKDVAPAALSAILVWKTITGGL